jgi:fatty-acyl-CoA synthase
MLPLAKLTIGQMLRRTAECFPDRPAMEYRGNVWSYRTLNRRVDLVSRRLLALGIRKGDHVGLWCEAEPNAILLLYAVTRVGAVIIPFHTGLTKRELSILVEQTDVSYLAIGDGTKGRNYPDLCRNLSSELSKLKKIIYIGQQDRGRGYTPFFGETCQSRGYVFYSIYQWNV